MLLIPFGIHRDTGLIIEPQDSPKGRACNCICPGCKAPLLSRHPVDRRWHFAHDSKHKEALPESECPLSPAVVFSMMFKHISLTCIGRNFLTPPFKNPVLISDIELDVLIGRIKFDACLNCDGKFIAIRFHHDSNPPPLFEAEDLQGARIDVVSINCTYFRDEWVSNNDNLLRFSACVLNYFLDSQHKLLIHTPPPLPVRVKCVMCNSYWDWTPGKQRHCLKCNTHLYIVDL